MKPKRSKTLDLEATRLFHTIRPIHDETLQRDRFGSKLEDADEGMVMVSPDSGGNYLTS